MQDHEVKAIIAEVLAEQKRLYGGETEEAVQRTISTILTSFGIEEEDRAELRADFIHLRKWRKSVEQAQSLTIKAMITVIVAAAAGALWLGIKDIAAGEELMACLTSHDGADDLGSPADRFCRMAHAGAPEMTVPSLR